MKNSPEKRPRRRVYLDLPLNEGEAIPLEGGPRRRLLTSLRMQPGDEVCVFNGRVEHRCVIETGPLLRVGPALPSPPESHLELTLIQGWAKGAKLDLAIEKGTELGVSRFVFFEALRSVPRARSDKKDKGDAPSRLERWRRLAVAATEQCGRLRPPEILSAPSLEEALAAAGEFDLAAALDPSESGTGLRDLLAGATAVKRAAVLVGPEGGLAEEELHLAESRGFRRVAAGPRILRAETAGVAACAVFQYALGDLGKSAPPRG